LKLIEAEARRGIAEWCLVREAEGARVVEGLGIGAGGGFICKTYIKFISNIINKSKLIGAGV
jgi:hypothetical protein